MENKQSGEVTISLSNSARIENEPTFFSIYSIIFSTAGFKIIYSFIFKELMFA